MTGTARQGGFEWCGGAREAGEVRGYIRTKHHHLLLLLLIYCLPVFIFIQIFFIFRLRLEAEAALARSFRYSQTDAGLWGVLGPLLPGVHHVLRREGFI